MHIQLDIPISEPSNHRMPSAQLREAENTLAVAIRVKKLEVERKKIEASRVK